MAEHNNRLLPWIAAGKLFKASALFIVAFGATRLLKHDDAETVQQWIRAIRIDPEDRIAHRAIEYLTGLSPHQMGAIRLGSLLYGLLFLTEGLGLAFRKRWAEYFTIVTTSLFLPLEIYEVFFKPHHKAVKALLLLLNIAVVVYLVWNVRRTSSPKSES